MFAETVPLPEHVWYMQLLSNVFNAWLLEGKKRRKKG